MIVTSLGLSINAARAAETFSAYTPLPNDYRAPHLATPYYNGMVNQAYKTWPARFDFMRFRILYARTRQYDPIGQKTLRSLRDAAYTVLHDQNPQKVTQAYTAYRILISEHLANLDVVSQALSLARQDRRFGDPEFFNWVREGLIKTVVISGNGNSLDEAYDVITLAEEAVLLGRLEVQKLQTTNVRESVVYYTMHDVRDLKTGELRTVFVNTTIPMRYLQAVAGEEYRTRPLNLYKQ